MGREGGEPQQGEKEGAVAQGVGRRGGAGKGANGHGRVPQRPRALGRQTNSRACGGGKGGAAGGDDKREWATEGMRELCRARMGENE
eukprot:6197565-Pleurochrysis_carterae.AAC.2